MARVPLPNLDLPPVFPSAASVHAAVAANGGAAAPQQPPQVHPPTPAIPDNAPVFRAIFEPMFVNLRLRNWGGVVWGDVDPSVIEGAVAIARKTATGATVTVDAFWRRATNTLAVDRWSAFTAWNLWHRDVARVRTVKPVIPRAWYILSSYPGDDYMIPEQWISAARRNDIPWGRWRLYTALGSLGVLRNGPDLMDEAMSLERKVELAGIEELARGGGGALPKLSSPDQRSGKQQYANLPDAWASAVASLCLGVSAASAGVYRSRLRRIVEEAGQGGRAAPDLNACAAAAARISTVYRTVWGRFVSILSEAEAEGLRRRRNTLFPHGRAAVFDAAEAKQERASLSAAFSPHGDD